MKKEKKYLIVGIVSTLVLMLEVSLAYFSTQIIGEGKKMTVNTANLEIIFNDTSEVIVENEILPGWSVTKTFTVENKTNDTYYYDISMKEYINTFVLDYLEYKITSTNGYNMESYKPLPKSNTEVKAYLVEKVSVSKGETQEYTIEFRYREEENVNQSEDMNKIFEGIISIEEGTSNTYPEGTLANQILKDNPTILGRTNFEYVYEENNTGTLFKTNGNETEDIDKDGIGEEVYYYAGNALNNWIKFGKDQDDNELYWRIIRTNEDGGVRLLYIGPDKATESAFIKIDGVYMSGGSDTTGMYNSIKTNTMYVGYMYGEEGSLESNRLNTISSPIKQKTDEWYSKTLNIKTDNSNNTYDKYVSRTAIYCNDRSTNSYSANEMMDYAALNRMFSFFNPSYKCGNDENRNLYSTANKADKFSASTTNGGNGQLDYPIAQITIDEIAYAGGVFGEKIQPWYYYNSCNGSVVGSKDWWTMSPYNFDSSLNNAYEFLVDGTSYSGVLNAANVSYLNSGVRPVLSLKSCVKYVSGDGSSTTPYEVEVDSTCATLEN